MTARRTDEEIRALVKEAVAEALRGANIIDGPTHIAHHQAIGEILSLAGYAKKKIVGGIVSGLLCLLLLGAAVWVAGSRG